MKKIIISISMLVAALMISTTAMAQTPIKLGLKVPQMSTDDRNEIPVTGNSAARGHLIYNTDFLNLEYWNGAQWVSLLPRGNAADQLLQWNNTLGIWEVKNLSAVVQGDGEGVIAFDNTASNAITATLTGTSQNGGITATLNLPAGTTLNNALKWNNETSKWIASPDLQGVTLVGVGTNGLVLGGTTAEPIISLPAATTTGQILKWNGTAWEAGADNDTNTFPALTSNTGLVITGSETASQTVNLPAATTTGQILKWNGTAWEAGADNDTNTFPALTSNTGLVITGSETASQTVNLPLATTNGQLLTWNGATWAAANAPAIGVISLGTTAPLTNTGSATEPVIALTPGATAGQVLKWNGTAWEAGVDNNDNTTYLGSNSVILNSGSFERAALTGDVTASQDANATTVVAIQNQPVSASTPTATGQVLTWNGTAWTAIKPASAVKRVTIPVANGAFTTESRVYNGILTETTAAIQVTGIQAIFQDRARRSTYLMVDASAEEVGNVVQWTVSILNRNIDINNTMTLQSVIISYICDDADAPANDEQSYQELTGW